MNPVFGSVYSLFEYKPCYFIPKYQRAYAWKEEQVNDFVKDLESAFDKRFSGRSKQHFFGGVISVMSQYPGTHNVNQYEVIDGQQRLSTFNILANIILFKYRDLLEEAIQDGNHDLQEKCRTQINDLEPRFLEFCQIIGDDNKQVKTFKMSRRDNEFYSKLIRKIEVIPTKDSHFRLQHAFSEISNKVGNLVEADSLSDKFIRLSVMERILATDFKILHLVTTNRQDAYQLFQVINDRGTSLTDADLLRCKILELMEGNDEYQDEAEVILDEIVSHEKTEEHLAWAYEAKLGERPKSGAIFDNYIDNYFELSNLEEVDVTGLNKLLEQTKELGKQISLIRELVDCQWPFPAQLPVEGWDRDRLSVLIDYLGNTAAIPLLVASKKLGHVKFSQIVSMLERFFFRYKMMCNGHNTQLKNIYTKHVKIIESDPENYDLNSLKVDLNSAIDAKANDELFLWSIDELNYSKADKKKIKHLLSMVSQYGRWVDSGENSSPKCMDKTVIIDRREGSTIEHIYPKGLGEGDDGFQAPLESLKNKLGNLCILSTSDNQLVDTDPFEEKKQVFSNSSLYLTRKVSEYPIWEQEKSLDYLDYIKQSALKIFVA
ncbi:DUF262 domain-containing protein [Vibrio crassostreae]|uniref:DUF262 domain-containing protein n=1 Tax=Vibrio crassostreae TaxID=246167 RepID=UPI0002E378DA|nr:DUF262 domain-containing protein [Vibrio crassostreae]OEE98617.1 hypothetical protein A138_17525 [Vibrio crassostreae 9ZC77]